MGRCAALYSRSAPTRIPRTKLELAYDQLLLTHPDGRWHTLVLHGCSFTVGDAACAQRFVRHLQITRRDEPHADLITPPDCGAIAPRAAGLPGVPPAAAVVETQAWEAVADWLRSGGRLSGCTAAELARLACVATPQFAVIIGQAAARHAVEMSWEHGGPMRGSSSMRTILQPLQAAARTSASASNAFLAALTTLAGMR